MISAPTRLRVEHRDAAVLGLGVRQPRLSWSLPHGTVRQNAYAVEVDGRDIGKVDSADCVLVPWPADPLRSRQRVSWRFKVWTDAGETDWSSAAWFETGLLDSSDWVARWIEPHETGQNGERGPHFLRHTFYLDTLSAEGRLYATAHGIYESFLNGSRVGDVELAPGFTSYPSILHVQVYDVTGLLVRGENEVEVLLADGWYRGLTGYMQVPNGYGDTLAFLAQLHAGDQIVGTGASWASATGSIVSADLMAGQVEDRRRETRRWEPVTVADHDVRRLTYSPAPPTRRVQDLRPMAVTRLGPDRHLVNLGQNINGWVRLTDLGPSGTELTLVHGEALDTEPVTSRRTTSPRRTSSPAARSPSA